MSKTKLIVYPTMRSMLSGLSMNESNLDIDLISLEDFFSKSSFVMDKFKLSNEQKYIYLSEIMENIDVSPLGISNDFLFFLKIKILFLNFLMKFIMKILILRISKIQIFTRNLLNI